jgi:hypothetical protein
MGYWHLEYVTVTDTFRGTCITQQRLCCDSTQIRHSHSHFLRHVYFSAISQQGLCCKSSIVLHVSARPMVPSAWAWAKRVRHTLNFCTYKSNVYTKAMYMIGDRPLLKAHLCSVRRWWSRALSMLKYRITKPYTYTAYDCLYGTCPAWITASTPHIHTRVQMARTVHVLLKLPHLHRIYTYV